MKPFDTQFLQAAILIASPLLLVALGELMSEVAGVLNVGLEGIMLVGAFVGFWAGGEIGNLWLAMLLGLLGGLVMSLIVGFATIEAQANQIVVGVAINILGSGLSMFAFEKYSSNLPSLFIGRMVRFDVPVLGSLPLVGPALFQQLPLVYMAIAFVPLTWVLFYRSRWGLRMRAAGELPEATETAGASVRSLRWQGVMIAGSLAGFAGAFLSVGMVGTFLSGITAGRGFLALAAVIVGGWRPIGVALAALFFGAADALQLRLQAEPFVPRGVWIVFAVALVLFLVQRGVLHRSQQRVGIVAAGKPMTGEMATAAALFVLAVVLAFAQPHVSLPSQLWLAIPYGLTIAAIAGVIVHVRQPSALTIPFVRGGSA
jgi:simple sugar transport system permease protein